MIVTKAYITSVPETESNIFHVRIPLMEDNTETESEFEAILATPSGVYKGIEVGDCVIVTFEDDKYDMAIILGKLFTDVPESTQAYGLFNQLEVTGSVVLPEDTKIGRYTPQDIFNLYQGVDLKEGGGSGSINPDDLKEYVQWTNTERQVNGETVDIYSDHIRIMTGDEYDSLVASQDLDKDEFDHTLYFLSSLPKSDVINN